MSRAERRRRANEDRRIVAAGLDAGRRDTVQVAALMRVLHGLLEESRDARTVAPMMEFLLDNVRAAGRREPRRAIACARGCAHCCHAGVSARIPEVLFLRRAIAPEDEPGIADMLATASASAGEPAPGPGAPCPLLRNDLCRIYPARPLTCRTAASSDATACERALRLGMAGIGIPTPEFYTRVRAGYALALAGALKRSGFAAAAYDLASALDVALARPDAEAAWLAGEPVFAEAVQDPMGDPFAHPGNRRFYDSVWTD